MTAAIKQRNNNYLCLRIVTWNNSCKILCFVDHFCFFVKFYFSFCCVTFKVDLKFILRQNVSFWKKMVSFEIVNFFYVQNVLLKFCFWTLNILLLYNSKARREILKIHTRQWTPPPSEAFLEELAEKCVGMFLCRGRKPLEQQQKKTFFFSFFFFKYYTDLQVSSPSKDTVEQISRRFAPRQHCALCGAATHKSTLRPRSWFWTWTPLSSLAKTLSAPCPRWYQLPKGRATKLCFLHRLLILQTFWWILPLGLQGDGVTSEGLDTCHPASAERHPADGSAHGEASLPACRSGTEEEERTRCLLFVFLVFFPLQRRASTLLSFCVVLCLQMWAVGRQMKIWCLVRKRRVTSSPVGQPPSLS